MPHVSTSVSSGVRKVYCVKLSDCGRDTSNAVRLFDDKAFLIISHLVRRQRAQPSNHGVYSRCGQPWISLNLYVESRYKDLVRLDMPRRTLLSIHGNESYVSLRLLASSFRTWETNDAPGKWAINVRSWLGGWRFRAHKASALLGLDDGVPVI